MDTKNLIKKNPTVPLINKVNTRATHLGSPKLVVNKLLKKEYNKNTPIKNTTKLTDRLAEGSAFLLTLI